MYSLADYLDGLYYRLKKHDPESLAPEKFESKFGKGMWRRGELVLWSASNGEEVFPILGKEDLADAAEDCGLSADEIVAMSRDAALDLGFEARIFQQLARVRDTLIWVLRQVAVVSLILFVLRRFPIDAASLSKVGPQQNVKFVFLYAAAWLPGWCARRFGILEVAVASAILSVASLLCIALGDANLMPRMGEPLDRSVAIVSALALAVASVTLLLVEADTALKRYFALKFADRHLGSLAFAESLSLYQSTTLELRHRTERSVGKARSLRFGNRARRREASLHAKRLAAIMDLLQASATSTDQATVVPSRLAPSREGERLRRFAREFVLDEMTGNAATVVVREYLKGIVEDDLSGVSRDSVVAPRKLTRTTGQRLLALAAWVIATSAYLALPAFVPLQPDNRAAYYATFVSVALAVAVRRSGVTLPESVEKTLETTTGAVLDGGPSKS